MSIFDKLVQGGHLTPEQIERIGESVHEFVKEADAREEFVEEYFDKTAALPPNFGKNMAYMAGIGLAGTAATALAGMGVDAARGWMNDLKKAKRYKAMVEANPELKARGVNSKMVQMHFNTLNRFNPDYADDPLVAGAYVQNQMEAARPNIESLNNIVQARKNRVGSESKSEVPKQLIAPMTQYATSKLTESGPPGPPVDPTPEYSRAKRWADVERNQAAINLAIRRKGLSEEQKETAMKRHDAIFNRARVEMLEEIKASQQQKKK